MATRLACLAFAPLAILSGMAGLPDLRAAQTGTASLAGIIRADDAAGTPIAGAAVTTSSQAMTPDRVAVTDAEGRFSVSGLPAGHFTLVAAKKPYLSMAYGQTMPGRGAGLPVALAEGQAVTDLSWRLPRGSVISGRILDARGRPMPGAPVVVMQYRMVNGQRRLQTTSCCIWPKTAPDGTYRVFGLVPGDYYVSAVPPGDYRFIGDGPWAAGNTETRVTSAAEVEWALAELSAGTNPLAPLSRPEPPPGPTVALGRVFYPGTPTVEGADVVRVGLGETREGIDFAMQVQRTARLELRVVGPDGQPDPETRISHTAGGGTSTRQATSLSLENLMPGRYAVSVRGARGALWAAASFDINGEDLTGVVLTLRPSPSISGRIVIEGAPETPPFDLTGVRLQVMPRPGGLVQDAAEADGTFAFHTMPGAYRLSVALPREAAGWMVASAMLGGRDVIDLPFDVVEGRNVEGIFVTLTNQPTELTGRLLDAAGRPAPGYYVVAFATEEAFWLEGARRLPRPAVSATDGTYRFTGLPAGEYYLAALTSVDAFDLADASVLRALADSAMRITIVRGERQVQDLRFAGAPSAVSPAAGR